MSVGVFLRLSEAVEKMQNAEAAWRASGEPEDHQAFEAAVAKVELLMEASGG